MSDIQIIPYEPWHGEHIAAHMRHMDRKEIYYLSALDPASAVRVTAAHAVAAWTAISVYGVPVCMFGINRVTRLSDVGVPWLMGTDAMDTYPATLAYGSRRYFERFARAFPKMENHVLAENDRVVRWLRWLGFDMEEPKPYGCFGAAFIRFGKGLD